MQIPRSSPPIRNTCCVTSCETLCYRICFVFSSLFFLRFLSTEHWQKRFAKKLRSNFPQTKPFHRTCIRDKKPISQKKIVAMRLKIRLYMSDDYIGTCLFGKLMSLLHKNILYWCSMSSATLDSCTQKSSTIKWWLWLLQHHIIHIHIRSTQSNPKRDDFNFKCTLSACDGCLFTNVHQGSWICFLLSVVTLLWILWMLLIAIIGEIRYAVEFSVNKLFKNCFVRISFWKLKKRMHYSRFKRSKPELSIVEMNEGKRIHEWIAITSAHQPNKEKRSHFKMNGINLRRCSTRFR